MKKLNSDGLVSVYTKKGKKYFSSTDPILLKERVDRQQKVIKKNFPELQALYTNHSQKPQIRFFEGKKGLGVVINEIYSEASELLAIASIDDAMNKLSEYFPSFSQERARRKIPLRVILKNTPEAKERQRLGMHELRKVKLVDSPISFHSLTWIWKNKFAMISLGEDIMVVVIESKDLTETWRAIFELLWEKY